MTKRELGALQRQLCGCMRACMLSRLSRVRLCDPMDSSPPGSSVHRILQARILDWAAIPFSSITKYLRHLACLLYLQRMSSDSVFLLMTYCFPPTGDTHRTRALFLALGLLLCGGKGHNLLGTQPWVCDPPGREHATLCCRDLPLYASPPIVTCVNFKLALTKSIAND